MLLRAVRRLRDREPDWTLALDIIGDGASRADLERLAADLGVADRIVWHGKRTHAEAFPIMAAAHAMALPIRSDPGPGVIPEGLGLGLPLLVTRVGGMADLLAGAEGVRLFAVDDDEALARHLHEILADRALRDRMSVAARQLFFAKFHLDQWVQRVVSWLESTVVPPAGRAAGVRTNGESA